MRNFKRILMILLCVFTLVLTISYGTVKAENTEKTYEKITSLDDLTDGNYLIVYEAGKKVFDSSLPTLDANNNCTEEEINIINDKITTKSSYSFNIVKNGDKYTIKSSLNLYIGNKDNANKLYTSTTYSTDYDNFITYDDEGNCSIIGKNNTYIKYNSGISRFRYYKSGQQPIALYKESTGGSTLTPLTTPNNSTLIEKVVSFDAVSNASGYTIGVFDGETLLKEYTTTETSFTIPFTPQGTFGVKVKANGDNVTYGSSEYSSVVGSFANTTILDKNITDLRGVTPETKAPYTYYKTTGIVTEIVDADTNKFKIKSTTNDDVLVIAGLLNTDKTESTLEDMGIDLYDSITLIGYRTTDSTKTIGGAYLVSTSYNADIIFKMNKMTSSLYVKYNYTSGDSVTTQTSTLSYAGGSSSINMTATDNASIVGLDSSIFTVNATPDGNTSYPLYPGLNKDGYIRVYDDGCLFTVSSINNITSITFNLDDQEQTVLLVKDEDGNVVTGEECTFTFTNENKAFTVLAASSTSVDINSITINYQTVAYDFEITSTSMRFGTVLEKKLYDEIMALDASAEFGVILAKTSDLQESSKTLEMAFNENAEYVKKVVCTPARVEAAGDANTSESGNYYQFAVLLNGFTTDTFDREYQAVCYVIYNETLYIMANGVSDYAKFSVKSLAQYYIDNNVVVDRLSVGALNEIMK